MRALSEKKSATIGASAKTVLLEDLSLLPGVWVSPEVTNQFYHWPTQEGQSDITTPAKLTYQDVAETFSADGDIFRSLPDNWQPLQVELIAQLLTDQQGGAAGFLRTDAPNLFPYGDNLLTIGWNANSHWWQVFVWNFYVNYTFVRQEPTGKKQRRMPGAIYAWREGSRVFTR